MSMSMPCRTRTRGLLCLWHALAATLVAVVTLTPSWTTAQRSPGPTGATAVLDGTTLYLFGGYEISRGRIQWTNRAVASLDLSKNFTASTTGLSLDYPVTGNTGIAYAVPVVDPAARLVHILGGFSGPQGNAPLRVQVNANSTLAFSLDTKSWTTMSGQLAAASLNMPRDHARLGNTLLVAPKAQAKDQLATWLYGGHSEDRGWLRDLMVAEPGVDSRSGSASVTLVNRTANAVGSGPTFRAIPCITPITPDRILISGGTNSAPASLADVWEFVPSTNTWTSLKSMAMGRINHRAVMYDKNEFLIIVGGQNEALRGAAYQLLEYFHFPTSTWYRGAIDNADASPIKSLTGHVAHVVGNQLVLVGGTFVKPDGVTAEVDTTPPPVSVLSISREAPGSAMLKFRWTDVYDASPLLASSPTTAGDKREGDVQETSKGASKLALIAGGGAAAVFVLGLVGFFVYRRRRTRRELASDPSASKLESSGATFQHTPPKPNGTLGDSLQSPTPTMQSNATSLPGYATNDPVLGKPPTFPSKSDEPLYLPPHQTAVHMPDDGPLYLPDAPSSGRTHDGARESLYLPGSMPTAAPAAHQQGLDPGVTVTLGPLALGASAPMRDPMAARNAHVHHLPQN